MSTIDGNSAGEWAEIADAYTRLRRSDPAGWREHLRELAQWDAVSDPDGTAAEEWPEYNS